MCSEPALERSEGMTKRDGLFFEMYWRLRVSQSRADTRSIISLACRQRMSFKDFCYGFVNTLSPEAQRAAYEAHVVPETGRIFFQASLSALEPHSEA